ncbi:MAG: alpha/beta hydrolase [Bacteroidales bacterium]|nr:alpha/beta hydrolase [Bacteroidales bacterium]
MIHLFEDRKINYNDSGKGIPIVLLHGYLESSEVWNGFGEKLASEFRVISIDLPGHGNSEVIGDVHTMELMASIVKDLIDNLGLKKVFLVGHSLGGYVTLAFLEYFPEYLIGYSLFHSQPLPDTPEAIEKRMREIAIVIAGKKHLMYPDNVTRMFATSNLDKFSVALQRSKDIASGIPGKGIIAALQGMIQRPSRLTFMEEGRVPCLWILGSMDSYIPVDAVQKKVRLPGNATVVVLQNSGHLGFIEEEELSLKTILFQTLLTPKGVYHLVFVCNPL